VVRVSENAIVGAVLFEGNQRFSDAQLLDMVDLGSRGTFTDQRLQTDVRTIQLAYDRAGYTNVSVSARTETMDNGRIRVVFQMTEGDRAGIGAITFSGNYAFDGNLLKTVIGTRESHLLSWLFKDDSFDEDRLTVDAEAIRIYYTNHGYPDAQILSAVSEYDASQNAYFITFTISEGERYTFGNIGIETSIPGLDTEALKPAIRTYQGSTFSARAMTGSAEELAVRATGQGYAFADVRPRIDRDISSRTFNITYLIDEGARIYVERINITGNDKTRDFVIRRELDFAEGDPFNRSLVTRGRSNIMALNYFSTVDISTAQGSAPDRVVLNISVVEKGTGDYGASIGYDSQQGVLGEVSLTETNFLGRGQYMRIAVGAAQSGRSFNFSFTEPRFMGLKVSAGIDVYKRITDESPNTFYGTDTTGGQFRIGIPITNEISSTVFAGYENKTFIEAAAPTSQLVVNGQQRNKAFIGYSLTYSTIDDPRRPTSGLRATFTQQYAGLDNNFVSSEVRARYFMPLLESSRIVASVRGQAGIITDFSGGGVHPTESFLLGSGFVRGFQYGGLGPRSAAGEPLGATYYAGLSAEIEFPLPVPDNYGLKGAVWLDAGYVGTMSAAVPAGAAAGATGSAQPLRASVGASLIWDSPFGPLRGDFAHVLQKDTGDVTQFFALTISSLL